MRPSEHTRFVLPIKEHLIFYKKFRNKGFFLLQPSVVLSVKVTSMTDPAASTPESFSLALQRHLQEGKKRRSDMGNPANNLVAMEAPGSIGKISK